MQTALKPCNTLCLILPITSIFHPIFSTPPLCILVTGHILIRQIISITSSLFCSYTSIRQFSSPHIDHHVHHQSIKQILISPITLIHNLWQPIALPLFHVSLTFVTRPLRPLYLSFFFQIPER